MATTELTPAVLRALATGIDRLNDGDPTDRQAADEAEKTLARAGYVASNGQCYPASNATSGYVLGCYVYQTADGSWSSPNVSPGDVLTFDEEGAIPLRTL